MCRTLCESNDWLQIDLDKTIEVCGVATQGNGHINGGGYREWTINFKLPYSVSPDGSGLTTYRDTQSADWQIGRLAQSADWQYEYCLFLQA